MSNIHVRLFTEPPPDPDANAEDVSPAEYTRGAPSVGGHQTISHRAYFVRDVDGDRQISEGEALGILLSLAMAAKEGGQ